ncbi:5'/3'-nucleotidase SurE [Paeniclostridium hominis]|uniref:5'-nucleotidase SurE n=1 Tax=Paeniclostridium hominis TaxID=2764329 RepID=A0ABR7K2M3_9FIRM|nr:MULTISPECIES: 5'/3'-nucleotidase SurE [Paeniclostridium]MBC6003242.1 5'/3'-nucleotidase SurE [Paeniclostridium hominis]
MNILITNDDGIQADGIIALAKAIKEIANVYVVAPDTQRSATGHAITIHNPIMIKEEYIDDNIKAYSISGTPADCVKLGIESIFKDVNIDLVLSGINNGANLGTDVIYSGTVSAAIEGLIQNKPAIAISYDSFKVSNEEYITASKHVVNLVNNIKNNMHIFDDCILNVNIPDRDIKGFKITKLGIRKYENDIEERQSPHGKRYVWIGGKIKEIIQEENSDISAIENGYISITPINIDMTNMNKIEILKNIDLL